MTNNIAERHMRNIALGRKNYHFVDSDRGGRAAANFYSLIETCKNAGIYPYEYVRDILERLPVAPVDQLEQLLPQQWVESKN